MRTSAARTLWHLVATLTAVVSLLIAGSRTAAAAPVHAPVTTVDDDARPAEDARWSRACSFRRPLCVHGDPTTPHAAVLATLASAERAWELLTGPLALPAPDPDPTTRAWDVYLVAGAVEATRPATHDGPRAAFDRASAFTRLDAHLAGSACALDTTITRELARAVLYRVSPHTDEATARAQTTYLARLAVPCAAAESDDVEVFQTHSDRALSDAWRDDAPPELGLRYARGAWLFWDFVDDANAAAPGGLVRATWALTPASDDAAVASPDAFDVLRTTLEPFDDVLLSFAVARAFTTRWPGPTREWDIDWPTAPRRLASGRPLAPGGSAYVLVHHRGAPAGARLRIEASWEEHARMRWVALKLDGAGHEKARIVLNVAHEKSTDVQETLTELDDTDSVLLVAVNAGDPTTVYHPGDAVFEPHAFLVTLAAQ